MACPHERTRVADRDPAVAALLPSVRRVAVVGDTHLPRGARRLPDECLDRLRAGDLIVHAGDFVGYEVLAFLRGLGPPVVAVRGNVDDERLRGELPGACTFAAGAATIGLVHDAGRRAGRAERLAARFPGCAAVVYGHTHLPELARHSGTWIVNPGSPTEPRRSPVRTMLELVVESAAVEPRLIELHS
ncbi:MAG: metallophosphoesterase family protein [Thermoleophilia bacterium]|nr:metallophosphoesterase family protein [Thermoleophilia bacterium]